MRNSATKLTKFASFPPKFVKKAWYTLPIGSGVRGWECRWFNAICVSIALEDRDERGQLPRPHCPNDIKFLGVCGDVFRCEVRACVSEFVKVCSNEWVM